MVVKCRGPKPLMRAPSQQPIGLLITDFEIPIELLDKSALNALDIAFTTGLRVLHWRRVGTPATPFVREAIKSGKPEGTYAGRTYEGLENISAFAVSSLTGWSAHIAFSNAQVSEAANLALTIGAVGGAIVLGLAALLTWLVVRDAKRRQRQSLALAQAQRIESLGRLTGGIAHDFNNLLTIIIGNLQRAREAPERERGIDAALTAARRAADLTRSLMAYSRQQPLTPRVVDANACVREAIEVIGRTLGEAYVVKQDLAEQGGAIRVDPGQLTSALVNLAVNARDAMTDGGEITISTRFRPASTDSASGEGGAIAITVSDNGPGMDADVASRAFEPFFTTKDVGKGTGLGLAQVQGFATQSGGSVELVTAPVTVVVVQVKGMPVPALVASDVRLSIGSLEALLKFSIANCSLM